MYRRPFASVAAMDDAMMAGWNDVVGPEDEIWHLGDVAVGPRAPGAAAAFAERLMARLAGLHGIKHLVTGNNDPESVRGWSGWRSVRDYAEIVVDGRKVVLCHYALRSWIGMAKGAVNLHGHSHGRLAPMTRKFDVGVDARGFRPVGLAGLLGRDRKSS